MAARFGQTLLLLLQSLELRRPGWQPALQTSSSTRRPAPRCPVAVRARLYQNRRRPSPPCPPPAATTAASHLRLRVRRPRGPLPMRATVGPVAPATPAPETRSRSVTVAGHGLPTVGTEGGRACACVRAPSHGASALFLAAPAAPDALWNEQSSSEKQAIILCTRPFEGASGGPVHRATAPEQ